MRSHSSALRLYEIITICASWSDINNIHFIIIISSRNMYQTSILWLKGRFTNCISIQIQDDSTRRFSYILCMQTLVGTQGNAFVPNAKKWFLTFPQLEFHENASRDSLGRIGFLKIKIVMIFKERMTSIFRRNAWMAFTPYAMGLGQIRSFETKWAPQISRESFGTESPNFTRPSIPNYSTAVPDVTPLATSGRKLSRKKIDEMPHPTASGGLSRERFEQG